MTFTCSVSEKERFGNIPNREITDIKSVKELYSTAHPLMILSSKAKHESECSVCSQLYDRAGDDRKAYQMIHILWSEWTKSARLASYRNMNLVNTSIIPEALPVKVKVRGCIELSVCCSCYYKVHLEITLW